MSQEKYDYILVGAGLANGILALKLHEQKKSFLLIDDKSSLERSQTWSFHQHDIARTEHQWLTPVITKSWPAHTVRFPKYQKQLNSSYHSITSNNLFAHIQRQLPAKNILLNEKLTKLSRDSVVLSDGQTIKTKNVIDGRGILPSDIKPCGYQKFLGLDIKLKKPHNLSFPILMDATVPQTDGYRFIYVLPWNETTLLVEDTYYSNTSILNSAHIECEIQNYIEKNWGPSESVLRREQAALAIPLTKNLFSYWAKSEGISLIGLRGGFFHPTTGYSLPLALQIAEIITKAPNKEGPQLFDLLRNESMKWQKKCQFYLFLNRMMFGAALPHERINIFERFYQLPEPLIQRFYASRLNKFDQMRILMGRPPVPVVHAIKSIFNTSWMEAQ
ncbi:MAG: lycopene beta-cyclase CrtY [Pseudomonadota bacterium]|nr:lycopene beta-cyclase CrtY [Pseudomonadota bacterium]